jgi:hypothetical protein
MAMSNSRSRHKAWQLIKLTVTMAKKNLSGHVAVKHGLTVMAPVCMTIGTTDRHGGLIMAVLVVSTAATELAA